MTRPLATAIAAITLSALALAGAGGAKAQNYLGTADYYAILAAAAITNTNATTVNGDIGLYPGTESSYTGEESITLTGTAHIGDSAAQTAQANLTTAYDTLSAMSGTDLSGQDLGGKTLVAGVYTFSSSAQLTGTLTLDGQGDTNSVFIFVIDSSLTTASYSNVVLTNGAQAGNVYFVVGSSATLGTYTTFNGKILALTSITLNHGAIITCGAALADAGQTNTGAVTLDNNTISDCALIAVGSDTTAGASAVAVALAAYIAAHGSLPDAFQHLLDTLSDEELAAALAQLSGETATGVAPTGMEAMDSFLSQLFDSAFADDEGTPQPAPNQPPRTVKALGYADEKQPTAVDAAFLALKANPTARSVWASVYGTRGTTEGDVSVGSTDRFASVFGVAAGYDYRVAPDMKVGVSFGVGRTNYNTTDGLGSGSSDMLQVAVYGKKDFGAAYLAGALAYAYNSVSTTRTAPAVTNDTFDASFNAHDVAARIEAGIHYGWLTPYAAASAQAFYTPAYQETSSTSSGSAYALAYDDSTTYSARTELGVRLARSFAIHNGKTLNLHGRVAWAHDFSSAPSVVATLQGLPGSPFTVTGASQGGDSVLVSAGADIIFINGFAIGSSFDGEFSDGSQSYGGRAHVRYTW